MIVAIDVLCGSIAGRPRPVRVAGRALAPFSWPLHHFPWDITGRMPFLLTSTGARARKVVQGPPSVSGPPGCLRGGQARQGATVAARACSPRS